MGNIRNNIEKKNIEANPKYKQIADCFLNDFDVTWWAELVRYNTTVPTFILKPTSILIETFDLQYEVLMVYALYDSMEARTMQAIETIFTEKPAQGRVDNLVCIIVTEANDGEEWVRGYVETQQDLRTYVVLSAAELLKKQQGYIRMELQKQFRTRDLFDVQLPLIDDMYFYGRDVVVEDILKAVRDCKNKGVFGLRKTGKTSLLYKVRRKLEAIDGTVLFYDCKNIKVRNLSWTELILDMCIRLGADKRYRNKDMSAAEIVELFEDRVANRTSDKPLVFIFDEIEYISFDSIQDKHWHRDYFDFWQTLWSAQSEYRKFAFIIAGVNSTVVEKSLVDKLQNPLFSIVQYIYLQGLERNDIQSMTRKIGRRMGMKFEYSAVDYLHKRYGGHPLLTRLALSYEWKKAQGNNINYTQDLLSQNENDRENELAPYCQHIVDVLDTFYGTEYLLLEFLAVNDIEAYQELATSRLLVNHLISYGLVEYEKNLARIRLPIIARYIGNKIRAESGNLTLDEKIPIAERASWLVADMAKIISYMRQLEASIMHSNGVSLYGDKSFPEADKLLYVPVANTESEFSSFISTVSKSFIESMEMYGKSVGKNNYFWDEIKKTYPYLFNALLRIKAYRNWQEHLKLNQGMQECFDKYYEQDLHGADAHTLNDGFFLLQQICLRELKTSIISEISLLS